MDRRTIGRLGDELFDALRRRHTVAPLTRRHAAISIDDSYRISSRFLERRLAEGERVVGKKIGVTSKAVQDMLGVYQPDFGFLTDRMEFADGSEVVAEDLLIQPRAEGEIAFRLKSDLIGPGIDAEAVANATEAIFPCIEIVDSRIRDWDIRIEDTIADNASCGGFVIGREGGALDDMDLSSISGTLEKNDAPLSTGRGANVQGSPLDSVAWLANNLARYDMALYAGELVLSGALVPLEPVASGDSFDFALEGIGRCGLRFS